MSLVSALNLLGIRSVHNPVGLIGPSPQDLLDEFDGFADAPLPLIYRDLDERYPGCRFVFTDRDVDSWLSSVEWMIEAGRRYGGWDSKPETVQMHRALYGSSDFRREQYRHRFLKHREEVYAHFAGRPRDLLVMNIGRGDGWTVLCPFLGRSVPQTPFPHQNRRVRFASLMRLDRRVRAWVRALTRSPR